MAIVIVCDLRVLRLLIVESDHLVGSVQAYFFI